MTSTTHPQRTPLSIVALAFCLSLIAPDASSQPRIDPMRPVVPPPPQVSECTQIVIRGGLKINLVATATDSTSVKLTWQGPPGDYEVKSAPGTGFATTVQLASPRFPQADRNATPPLQNGAVTHSGAQADFQYVYTIDGILKDGRKACGSATAKTPPARAGGVTVITRHHDPPPTLAPLTGWVDLHAHPMSNLAFGGKLFHGGVDSDPNGGSLLPAVQMPYDPQCRFDVRAKSMEETLSDDAPTHGDHFQSSCGSDSRKFVIWKAEDGTNGGQPGHRIGAVYPPGPPGAVNPLAFGAWPRWNDITHQKMWVEWIRRAKDGGLRVMVALSHNNRLLGEVVGPGHLTPSAPGMPISGPTDDVHSSDLQIAEIKAFVLRHPDFMEVALTAADVYRIAQSQRIAIVLGIEIDNIGGFNERPAISWDSIQQEIRRLYDQGVRYIFPIHVTDNMFGDTAIYDDTFNFSNYREMGRFWNVRCAVTGEEIGFKLGGISSLAQALQTKMGLPLGALPAAPVCPAGHANGRTAMGLTPLGEAVIKEMMKRGMIIDIDHMSHRAAERTLQIAEGIAGGGYPLVSGHSGIRAQNGEFNAENSRTRTQLQRIGCLQGMFGLGTSEADAYEWAKEYVDAFTEMSKPFSPMSQCPNKVSFGPGSVAFGTDMNSLVKTPRPTMGPDLKPGAPIRSGLYNIAGFPTTKSSTGGKTWDYNLEGVAHYGMYADFVKDVRIAPPSQSFLGMAGIDLVDNHLMRGADYFWHMWEKCEAQKIKVGPSENTQCPGTRNQLHGAEASKRALDDELNRLLSAQQACQAGGGKPADCVDATDRARKVELNRQILALGAQIVSLRASLQTLSCLP